MDHDNHQPGLTILGGVMKGECRLCGHQRRSLGPLVLSDKSDILRVKD